MAYTNNLRIKGSEAGGLGGAWLHSKFEVSPSYRRSYPKQTTPYTDLWAGTATSADPRLQIRLEETIDRYLDHLLLQGYFF